MISSSSSSSLSSFSSCLHFLFLLLFFGYYRALLGVCFPTVVNYPEITVGQGHETRTKCFQGYSTYPSQYQVSLNLRVTPNFVLLDVVFSITEIQVTHHKCELTEMSKYVAILKGEILGEFEIKFSRIYSCNRTPLLLNRILTKITQNSPSFPLCNS